MTLIERAQELISQPALDKLKHLLRECVSAGTQEALASVQLLAEDSYGGFTFNLELKSSAAWCLVAWQEQGLQAIMEIAQRTQTFKNYSLAFQILSTLSARERFSNTWPTERLRNMIEARVSNWDDTFAAARIRLNELARSIPSDDDAAFYAAGPIQYFSLTATTATTAAVKPLFFGYVHAMALCRSCYPLGV